MPRVFLFDVDGTLTDKRNRIFPESIPKLRSLVEQGDTVALASGNVIPYMVSLRMFLGINGPVFGENGGIVYHRNKISAFGNIEKPMELYRNLSETIRTEEMFSNRWRELSVAFWLPDQGELPYEFAEFPQVEITDSGFAWHILNKGLNKSKAVSFICEQYSCEPSDLIAFGDFVNDIPMFESGVHGVTYDGAPEALKQLAEVIVDTKEENWILRALDSAIHS